MAAEDSELVYTEAKDAMDKSLRGLRADLQNEHVGAQHHQHGDDEDLRALVRLGDRQLLLQRLHGHAAQRAPGFNEVLERFLTRAERC